jgi:hypothetical protein
MVGNLAVLSSCGHAFHRCCVDEWYQKAHKCPVCRDAKGRVIPLYLGQQSNDSQDTGGDGGGGGSGGGESPGDLKDLLQQARDDATAKTQLKYEAKLQRQELVIEDLDGQLNATHAELSATAKELWTTQAELAQTRVRELRFSEEKRHLAFTMANLTKQVDELRKVEQTQRKELDELKAVDARGIQEYASTGDLNKLLRRAGITPPAGSGLDSTEGGGAFSDGVDNGGSGGGSGGTNGSGGGNSGGGGTTGNGATISLAGMPALQRVLFQQNIVLHRRNAEFVQLNKNHEDLQKKLEREQRRSRQAEDDASLLVRNCKQLKLKLHKAQLALEDRQLRQLREQQQQQHRPHANSADDDDDNDDGGSTVENRGKAADNHIDIPSAHKKLRRDSGAGTHGLPCPASSADSSVRWVGAPPHQPQQHRQPSLVAATDSMRQAAAAATPPAEAAVSAAATTNTRPAPSRSAAATPGDSGVARGDSAVRRGAGSNGLESTMYQQAARAAELTLQARQKKETERSKQYFAASRCGNQRCACLCSCSCCCYYYYNCSVAG